MNQKKDLKSYLDNLELSNPVASYSPMRPATRRARAASAVPSGSAPPALSEPMPVPISPPLLQDGKEQAVIVDKSLISFVSQVSMESREDILDSTLLAQLGAKAKVPDESDSIGWYKAYIDILTKIGWTIEGGDVQHYTAKGNVFELQGVIIDILLSAFGANFVQIATKVLNAIKSLADSSGKIEAFEKNTHTESTGSFQIGVASEENGAVSINLGTFLISSTNKITHILFIKFSNDETDLQYASGKLTLDKDVYAKARQMIRDKLSTRSVDFVADIPL